MMREFFRPLRRKLGVLTLVVACAFTSGWVRSNYKIDECAISWQNGFQFIFVSAYQQCGVKFSFEATQFIQMDSEIIDQNGGCTTRSTTGFNDATFFQCREHIVDHGSVKTLEFRVQGNNTPSAKIPLYLYWSLVAPLTIASACLLLSQPQARPKQPASHS